MEYEFNNINENNKYNTDKVSMLFLNMNNIKSIADKIWNINHGYENKKELYRRISELMNKWIEQVPRDNYLLPINDLNFLNALFLNEHKDDLIKWTFNKTIDCYDTIDTMQDILWYGKDISYNTEQNLNLLASQLHPRHVSQKMLVKRNYLMDREEPIYDSHFESKGNQIRGYKMDDLYYNNTGFGYYGKWH